MLQQKRVGGLLIGPEQGTAEFRAGEALPTDFPVVPGRSALAVLNRAPGNAELSSSARSIDCVQYPMQITMAEVPLVLGARELYENSQFLDFTIAVGKRELRVHRFVLVATSNYFKALASSEMVEQQRQRVSLHHMSEEAVTDVVHYMYYDQFRTGRHDKSALLECAVYFDVPGAIEKCVDSIVEDELEIENAFDILKLFEMHNVVSGIQATEAFIRCNYNEVFSAYKQTTDLYVTERLVHLWQKAEYKVYQFLTQEKTVDKERLLCKVRFGLLTDGELQRVKASSAYRVGEGSWKELVTLAEEYLHLHLHSEKVVFYRAKQKRATAEGRNHASEISKQNEMRGQPDTLAFYECSMCFTKGHEHNTMHFLNTIGNWWAVAFCMDSASAAIACAAAYEPGVILFVNGFIVVCQDIKYPLDRDTKEAWTLFDPRVRKWKVLSSPEKQKSNAAVVYHGEHMYVLGGELKEEAKTLSKSIERYEFATDTWEQLSSTCPVPIRCHGACSMDGYIYIAGGKTHAPSDKGCLSLERFQPCSGKWRSLQNMPKQPHLNAGKYYAPNTQLVKFGKERIGYLDKHFNFMCYDPRQSSWKEYKTPSLFTGPNALFPATECKVVAGADLLYIVFPSEATVVVYRPEDGNCAEIPLPGTWQRCL